MNAEIEFIYGHQPNDEREHPIFYRVGMDGVTRIEQITHSEQPHCEAYSFQVWKGDSLFSNVTWLAVAEISYKQY